MTGPTMYSSHSPDTGFVLRSESFDVLSLELSMKGKVEHICSVFDCTITCCNNQYLQDYSTIFRLDGQGGGAGAGGG